MAKIAVVVLADTETHGDLGRVANALMLAGEAKEKGDEIELIFDGGGTRWVPELADESHKAHPAFMAVRDKVAGACAYCANAFGVKDRVIAADVPLLDEYRDHPSLRTRIEQGFHVVTF